MKCPRCGAEIPNTVKFCEYCGTQITVEMLKEQELLNKNGCPRCGSTNITFSREKQGEIKGKNDTKVIRSTVGLCKDCGYTWHVDDGQQEKSSKWLWVLGWICCFPIPLTILILRKKDMEPKLKYGLIAALWILFVFIGLAGEVKNSTAEGSRSSTSISQSEKEENTIGNENSSSITETYPEAYNETSQNEEASQEELQDFSYSEPYYSYSGNGDDVVTGILSQNFSYAHIVHNGEGAFSVKGHYDDTYDLLVDTTTSYDGLTLIYPNKEYMFEVSAEGDWMIELFTVGTSSNDAFSGSGDFVTPIFQGSSNVYEITSSGEGNFVIWGWTNSGRDLLVDTIDKDYSGKVVFKNNDLALFVIKSEREWSIKPVH